jgi:hypothetical protein
MTPKTESPPETPAEALTGEGLVSPPCSALVEAVTMHRTTDGKTFHGEASAIGHQEDIEEAKKGNTMLKSGESVGAILRALGKTVADEILDQVTKESKLVISHWQCRDTPGYQPRYFEPGLLIYVGGDAGSWSGSYGNTITTRDLARYAEDSRSVLEPNAKDHTS